MIDDLKMFLIKFPLLSKASFLLDYTNVVNYSAF